MHVSVGRYNLRAGQNSELLKGRDESLSHWDRGRVRSSLAEWALRSAGCCVSDGARRSKVGGVDHREVVILELGGVGKSCQRCRWRESLLGRLSYSGRR